MARGDQLSRQWKIIQRLFAATRGVSASDLSKDLACHSRTVYRDLEALQLAGFPLYNERVDGTHLWSILDTVKRQPPLPLNQMELMALYFSRNVLKTLKNTPFDGARASPPSLSRLAELNQISPPQVRMPITVPSPRRRKPSANASPSDAVF